MVELDSRIKKLESVIMTIKARECELESIMAALDANRKELHNTLTEYLCCQYGRIEIENQ